MHYIIHFTGQEWEPATGQDIKWGTPIYIELITLQNLIIKSLIMKETESMQL